MLCFLYFLELYKFWLPLYPRTKEGAVCTLLYLLIWLPRCLWALINVLIVLSTLCPCSNEGNIEEYLGVISFCGICRNVKITFKMEKSTNRSALLEELGRIWMSALRHNQGHSSAWNVFEEKVLHVSFSLIFSVSLPASRGNVILLLYPRVKHLNGKMTFLL